MEKNEISFLTIYRKLVIRNIILYHLKMLNINYHKRYVLKTSLNYQYQEYLRSVILYHENSSILLNQLLQSLPERTEIIELRFKLEKESDHFINFPKHLYNIRKLKLGDSVFKSIEFPKTLTSLDMGNEYDPTKLKLSGHVAENDFYGNRIFSKLDNLIYLNLGNKFNQEFSKGYLPESLKTLKFGKSFSKPLKDIYLPSSITELEFGDDFFDSVSICKDSLPTGLISLVLGKSCKDPFSSLPNGLVKLKIPNCYMGKIDQSTIPISLTSLKIQTYTNQIPKPSKPLKLGFLINLRSLKVGPSFYVTEFPINRELLKFKCLSNNSLQTIGEKNSVNITPYQIYRVSIPNESLDFISKYDIKELCCKAYKDGPIPKSVKHLFLKEYNNYNGYAANGFNLPWVQYDLPNNVISFREGYNGSDKKRDYSSLTHLQALSVFHCYEKYKLPNGGLLKLLELKFIFDTYLDTSKLPSSIETLIIQGDCLISLPLSSNIKSIYVSSTNYKFLNRINFKQVPDLLEIIKVIDFSNDIYRKLIKQFK